MKFGLRSEDLDKIKKVFQNKAISNVYIFGSRAKGNFKPGSDIDLCIKDKKISLDGLLVISTELDELNLPYEFDLVSYEQIESDDLKEHIDRAGILI